MIRRAEASKSGTGLYEDLDVFLVRSGPLRLNNRQTRDQGTVRKSLPACTESAARQHQVLA